jgi:hypothetical protein
MSCSTYSTVVILFKAKTGMGRDLERRQLLLFAPFSAFVRASPLSKKSSRSKKKKSTRKKKKMSAPTVLYSTVVRTVPRPRPGGRGNYRSELQLLSSAKFKFSFFFFGINRCIRRPLDLILNRRDDPKRMVTHARTHTARTQSSTNSVAVIYCSK